MATTRDRSVIRSGGMATLVAVALGLVLGTGSAVGASPPTEGERETRPSWEEWLAAVDALLSEEERRVFEALTRDYQRRAFVERFWEVRDPYPETPRNELRDRWEIRSAEATERFGDLEDPRARTWLVFGPPSRTLRPICPGTIGASRDLEVWQWNDHDLVQRPFAVAFVLDETSGRFRSWRPGGETGAFGDRAIPAETGAPPEACPADDDLVAALGRTVDLTALLDAVAPLLSPDPEWVETFAARTTEVPADAGSLPATFEIRFPGRRQSRTVVEIVATLPGGSESPGEVVLDGEVIRDGDLFESFRYRYTLPPTAGPIPLVAERALRPGRYTLAVRLHDPEGERFSRTETTLDVPWVAPGDPPVDRTAGGEAPGPGVASHPPEEPEREPSVRLVPLPERLLTGLVRLRAETSGEGIARVRFAIDGRPVLTKARPPYSVEVDLGSAPRLHRVEAVAEDRDGSEIARDELAVNAGPYSFSVRLVEPGPGARGDLRARAVVEVPRGESLERVEFFLGDTLLATLYQEPFVHHFVPGAAGSETSYVRTVAHLESGGTAEDLVFLDAPDQLDAVDVQMVELYTTVLDRRGEPVPHLEVGDFRVLEGGVPQEIRRFEWVENLPVHLSLLIDSSTSMLESLPQAERAALGFFREVLTERDRASVVTFADRPGLRVPFTGDVEVLAGGLAGLEADGETALWDSLAFGLFHFGGIRGKKLLVLISDGEDVSSRFTFDEVLDYARRSGVAIYPIGVDLPSDADRAGMALRTLAAETGGRAFFVGRTGGLGRIYEEIGDELRSQYLLSYQSTEAEDDDTFRPVEVIVDRPGHEARTIRGYYP